ncbi:hypothetical protein CKO51_32930 [Rhodopirellula sp. SM50]|nr:hypothetical protein CKO51_32930 [Rhodopirellula sp. SM50]
MIDPIGRASSSSDRNLYGLKLMDGDGCNRARFRVRKPTPDDRQPDAPTQASAVDALEENRMPTSVGCDVSGQVCSG